MDGERSESEATRQRTISRPHLRPLLDVRSGGFEAAQRNLRALAVADRSRSVVPYHRRLSEVRFVRHVTGKRGVVSEHDIFHHPPSRPHRVEEIREVWTKIVIIIRHSIGN